MGKSKNKSGVKEEREKRKVDGRGSQTRLTGEREGKWWVGPLPNDLTKDEIESGVLAPN